ncbi:M48 family metalloprotease, partial [bacterium]|nr:M48 family metalloprotease [bacterium]
MYYRERSGVSPQVVVAIVMLLVGAVTYLASGEKNPITGKTQRVGLSPPQEIRLGIAAAPGMERQYGGTTEDTHLASYVASVGQRIVARSAAGRTPYRYEFHVLRDPRTVNAFALPGGQVFITVGLLRHLGSEAQLAGVLGHEVGHVVARHGAQHIAKERFAETLVGAVGVATYDGRSDRGAAAAALAAACAELVTLKYGRDDELESDSLGVRFMREAGYSPRAMIQVMKVLASLSKGGRTPEFFSTHPNPDDRLAR